MCKLLSKFKVVQSIYGFSWYRILIWIIKHTYQVSTHYLLNQNIGWPYQRHKPQIINPLIDAFVSAWYRSISIHLKISNRKTTNKKHDKWQRKEKFVTARPSLKILSGRYFWVRQICHSISCHWFRFSGANIMHLEL